MSKHGRMNARRQRARAIHQVQKRRARYEKVIALHASEQHLSNALGLAWPEGSPFENLLTDLSSLNPKCLQQLLSDLNEKGPINPFNGEYHKKLISSIETMIMERTVLK